MGLGFKHYVSSSLFLSYQYINSSKTSEKNQQTALGLTYWDVTDGKQTDTRVAVHRPLLRLTVGLAAVVHEARVVPLRTSINDPVLQKIKALVTPSSYLPFRIWNKETFSRKRL